MFLMKLFYTGINRFLRLLVIFGLLLAMLFYQPRPVKALTFTVTKVVDTFDGVCDSDCSLREAISAANASPGADTIVLPAGTYDLSIDGFNEDLNASGDLDIRDSVTITGAGAAVTIVRQTIGDRVFHVHSGVSVVLENLTITGGFVSSDSFYPGGGIYNQGVLSLKSSVVRNNVVKIYSSTGGICPSGKPQAMGGGIYSSGSITISLSTISHNSVVALDGLYGTAQGGGVFMANGTIVNSTITINQAHASGGNWQCSGSAFAAGGGVYGNGTIINSTIFNNSLLAIASNSTEQGSGVSSSGSMTLKNTIVAQNDCYNVIDGGYNIDSGNTCGFSAPSMSNTNPNLGSLTGSPPYFPLNPGSPAIDAGDNSTCSANPVNNQSQNGVMRPADGNGDGVAVCDIGSFEMPEPPLDVTINQSSTQSDPTSSSPIHFTAVFSKRINISTFTAGDVDLSSSTTPGSLVASISEIAPFNGTTFDVAVSGMTGSGIVVASIPANVVQSLTGTQNTASTSTDNQVTYILPLNVVSTSLLPIYTGTGPSSFNITFNQDVFDPSGNSDPDDVTNPHNYVIINKGINGVPDTSSCAGGVSSDDISVPVVSVVYNNLTKTSTVTLSRALGIGKYRLLVCGTTSIVDSLGNPLNGGTDYIFDFSVEPVGLPQTGFSPDHVTRLPEQPVSKVYRNYGELILEIPSLDIRAVIVGVPKSNGAWDVTWLGNSIGWLEGSAFPTLPGNTVLTAHVWNADNTPGVFAQIKSLKYGDRIYIHAFQHTYTYEVRENSRILYNNIAKAFKHEDYDWITLLTCEGYNPFTGNYFFRRMVRAVLIQIVEWAH